MKQAISFLPLLLTAALVGTSDRAFADADVWGGKGYSLGNGTCNPADLAKIQPLVVQLMKPVSAANPFGPNAGLGLNQAQAVAKVKEIRANIGKMVALAKGRNNAARSKFIQDQFDAGNICVSWGMTVLGTNIIDKAVAKKASEITVMNIKDFIGGPMACHDPIIVCGADTIHHENRHAGQSYAPDLPANPTADQTRAAKGMKYACNEVEAHGDAETWYGELETALCNANLINPAMPLPGGLNPAIKSILESLRAIADPAARAAAIAKLKKAAKRDSDWNGDAKACYQIAKNAFNNFILGNITKAQLKAILNNNRWKHYTSWLDHPAFVRKVAPATIEQSTSLGDPGPDINTGLQEIKDFEVLAPFGGNNALLVIGTDGGGFGELQVYFDTNGDELFEAASQQILFTGAFLLQSNMDLFMDPETQQMFVYDALQLSVFELFDSNFDQIPDQLGPQVTPFIPEMEDYLQFVIDPSAPFPTMICHEPIDSTNPAIQFDGETLLIMDTNSDGFFETVQPFTFEEIMLWAPTFELSIFGPGAPDMQIYGVPGAQLEVWLTDPSGALIELRALGLGQGVALPDQVTLSTPFQVGEEVVIVDQSNGLRSSNYLLEPPAPFNYCTGNLNSAGTSASISMTGSAFISNNDMGLLVQGGVPNRPGLFFYGPNQINIPFGEGVRCVGGSIFRIPPAVFTDGAGSVAKVIDFNSPPLGSGPGAAIPGNNFNFQYWYRDPAGGPFGFNLSDGLNVTFGP